MESQKANLTEVVLGGAGVYLAYC